VIPIGVVTVTVKEPTDRVQVAFTVVDVDALTVQVLLVPDTVTAAAPIRFVPVSVSRTPVPCVAGFGVTELRVGPSTVKVWVLLIPPGVVTLTFLAVSPAVAVIVKVAVIVVGFTTVRVPTVTPDPETVTLVPVAVKFVPVSVTGTAVPRRPLLGVIESSVDTGGTTTVNVTALLVPPGVVAMLTFLAVSPAPAAIAKVAVAVVSFTTVRLLTVIPLPAVIAVAPVSPLPDNVTGTLVPCHPVLGAIEVSDGPCTVKVWVWLVPPGVVTLTVLALIVVVAVIVKVAVIDVEFTTVRVLTVIPVPDTATLVPVEVKSVPVSVTGTAVPRTPELGVTEISVGTGGTTAVNVTGLLAPPGTVVTLTFLAVSPAAAAIVKVAVTVVSFTTVRLLTVIPPPAVMAVAPVRPLPVNVTGTLVPCSPMLGAMEVSDGPCTVKVWVLLVPPGVVTMTFLAPISVVVAIVKVVVIVPESTTVMAPTVTPVPDTATSTS
jgi:hypothetical protein